MRDRKKVDSDGREGNEKCGGVEGGENIWDILYDKKYPFSITENKIKNKFIKRKENVHDKDSVCILSKFFVLFRFVLFSFLFTVPSSGLLL